MSQTASSTRSRQRTLEQERAAEAWDRIVEIKKENEKVRKEYGQLARKAPANLQINGLGQTLAFWRAKGTPADMALFRDVSSWVLSKLTGKKTEDRTKADLLVWIMHPQTSTNDYRRATSEAMAFLIWVRRFAEAELKTNTQKKGQSDAVSNPPA